MHEQVISTPYFETMNFPFLLVKTKEFAADRSFLPLNLGSPLLQRGAYIDISLLGGKFIIFVGKTSPKIFSWWSRNILNTPAAWFLKLYLALSARQSKTYPCRLICRSLISCRADKNFNNQAADSYLLNESRCWREMAPKYLYQMSQHFLYFPTLVLKSPAVSTVLDTMISFFGYFSSGSLWWKQIHTLRRGKGRRKGNLGGFSSKVFEILKYLYLCCLRQFCH